MDENYLQWRLDRLEASKRFHEERKAEAIRFPMVDRVEADAEIAEFDRRIRLDEELAENIRKRMRGE